MFIERTRMSFHDLNIYNDRIQVEELKPPEASFHMLYFIRARSRPAEEFLV